MFSVKEIVLNLNKLYLIEAIVLPHLYIWGYYHSMVAALKIEDNIEEIISFNPATGAEVGRVRQMDANEVVTAVEL